MTSWPKVTPASTLHVVVPQAMRAGDVAKIGPSGRKAVSWAADCRDATARLQAQRSSSLRLVSLGQAAFVHTSLQLAACTPALAMYMDLTKPLGPSWLNPLGRCYPSHTQEVLMSLGVTNLVLAPILAHCVVLATREPRWLVAGGTRARHSAAITGALGACVGALCGIWGVVQLERTIIAKKDAFGWADGGFPDTYYWHAGLISLTVCVPLMAYVSFFALSGIDAFMRPAAKGRVRGLHKAASGRPNHA